MITIKRKRQNFSKLLSSIFIFILLFFSTNTIFAANTVKHTINELDLSIDLPNNLVVFTRNIDPKDKNLALFGFDKAALENYYKSAGIYLNAIAKDLSYEIVIIMPENAKLSGVHFLDIPNDQIMREMLSSIESEYTKLGLTYKGCEIYQNEQTKFLKAFLEQSTERGLTRTTQYYTVYKNKPISITMHSYNKTANIYMQKPFQTIVDSAVFSTLNNKEVYYNNENIGVSFKLPTGWLEKPLFKERKHLKIKYVNNNDTIMFGFTDIWSQLPDDLKKAFKKSDLNSDIFSIEDVKEMFATDTSKIISVDYEIINDIKYFKVIRKSDIETNNTIFTLTLKSYVIYLDGIMYEYILSTTKNTTENTGFLALMKSIKYKNPPKALKNKTILKNNFELDTKFIL